jgi:hypothetical protein
MSYTYEQSTGNMIDPDGSVVATGYAGGNCGQNPEGKNNPEMQGVKSIGPLPEGWYDLGEPVEHSHLGAYAIPLIPDPANDMLGRGDFYLHGDTTPSGNASEGCIIMPRAIRESVKASGERLQVIDGR